MSTEQEHIDLDVSELLEGRDELSKDKTQDKPIFRSPSPSTFFEDIVARPLCSGQQTRPGISNDFSVVGSRPGISLWPDKVAKCLRSHDFRRAVTSKPVGIFTMMTVSFNPTAAGSAYAIKPSSGEIMWASLDPLLIRSCRFWGKFSNCYAIHARSLHEFDQWRKV
ncbi:hypothetical protein PoB_005468100 [Plakobranchus ocellatus]|uniref:Uncharacterized protein n=1 Tax=Plakobranchus ocellatus TaxID=259542 RepID=A0AAV4C633_9GAST|nr:hypothetical protein PoB_005468100 [Plakobranchus ocellatus]